MKSSLLLFFVLVTMFSFGQEKWETMSKIGINCSFMSRGISNSGNKIFLGATGGLEQTYFFDNSIFSVQSGLEYEYIGEGTSTIGVTVGSNPSNNGTLSRSNANYLSIPLHLKCMINERWGALAGTAYRFGIGDWQSGNYGSGNDISLDAGFFYKMKNMRFNLIYQHGLREANSGYQMVQSKNRTITFSVSTPLWKY